MPALFEPYVVSLALGASIVECRLALSATVCQSRLAPTPSESHWSPSAPSNELSAKGENTELTHADARSAPAQAISVNSANVSVRAPSSTRRGEGGARRACVACGRAAAGEMASIPTLLGGAPSGAVPAPGRMGVARRWR
jgi:hypothetical protein